MSGEKNVSINPTVCMNGLTVTCGVVEVSESISQLYGKEPPWL